MLLLWHDADIFQFVANKRDSLMPSHDLWIMKYEYEQPHWVTKTITDTATAKHSNPSAAAKFLYFNFSLSFVGNAPRPLPFLQVAWVSLHWSWFAVVVAWLAVFGRLWVWGWQLALVDNVRRGTAWKNERKGGVGGGSGLAFTVE